MLDERSNRLAQALLAAGAEPGSRIAYLDRSAPEIVELLFAASKIGAVAVPLNWRLAVPELGRCSRIRARRSSSPGRTTRSRPPRLPVRSRLPPRLIRVAAEYEDWLESHEAVDPGGSGEADDVVLQLYTSGPRASRRACSRPIATSRPARDLAVLAIRRGHGLCDPAADVSHRRHRMDVPRPLERRNDDSRARVRARRRYSISSSVTSDERHLRSTMLQMLDDYVISSSSLLCYLRVSYVLLRF